jgi:hypothetical protein
VSLGVTAEKLREAGVETVAVVATPVDRARRYFHYRPPRCLVGADPELNTHRAFRVPRCELTDEFVRTITARVDGLARDEGLEAQPGGGSAALDRHDRIDSGEHLPDFQRHQVQFIAQFLLDRAGVIRWANIECEQDGLEGLDRFPTEEELLAAARAL